jgi:hypothetical protein
VRSVDNIVGSERGPNQAAEAAAAHGSIVELRLQVQFGSINACARILWVVQTFNLGGKMKRTIITLTVVMAALVPAILFGSAKAQNFNSSAAIASPAPMAAPSPTPEANPQISAAIRNLQEAQAQLEKAPPNFGGHRTLALDQTRRALVECRAALEWERIHPR